ncbi:MAG: hypothetical protein JNM56_06585 [Planctomycetia bacterium]|nr:hypothetical protein [Planctomycetia bacterium]
MPAMRRLLGTLVCLGMLAVLPARAAVPDKYLPADTDAVVIINVQQILASPLFKTHYQTLVQDLLKSNDDVQKTLKGLNLDPLKDIDQVVFANGESLYRLTKGTVNGKTVYGSNGGYFFLIKGRFDLPKFRVQAEQLAKEKGAFPVKAQKTGTIQYYEVDVGRTLFVGLVDATTIAVSSRAEPVVEALEKAAGKRKTGFQLKELVPAITKLDAKKSVSIAVTGNAGFGLDADVMKVGGKIVEKPVKQTISQDGLDAINGSIQITDGIVGEVQVSVKGANVAKDVAKALQEDLNDSIELIFKTFINYPKLAPAAEFVKAITIKVKDNKTVVIDANVSAKQVADSLK